MQKQQTAAQKLINEIKELETPEAISKWLEDNEIPILKLARTQIVDGFDIGQANHCKPIDYDNGADYFTSNFKS